MRVFLRFFLLLVFFGLVPVALAFGWFSRSYVVVRENARSFHSQLARVAADAAEEAARDMNLALGFVTELDAGQDRTKMASVLQKAAASNPDLLLLSLADSSGARVFRLADGRFFPEGPAEDAAWQDISRRAAQTGKVCVGPARLAGDKPYVALAYPLAGGGTLRVAYGLERLWRRLRGLHVGSTGRVVLTDAEGRPMGGLGDGVLEPAWTFQPSEAEADGWSSGLSSAKGALVGAWAAVPSLQWTVISLQRREEAFAVGERFIFEAAGLLLGICALVFLAAFWLSGRISQPLRSLAAGAVRVRREEFGKQVPEDGWAEFRVVQKAFNEMTRSLASYQALQVDRQLDEKAKVDALVRAVPSGIVLAAPDGKVLYVNSAARAILGESGATMPGAVSMEQIVREPKLIALIREALSGAKTANCCELQLEFHGEAKPRIYFCLGRAVAREKRVLGAMILLTDVTAERDLERMKETFLHGIVHDLRGPIGTMSGWLEALEMKGAIPEAGRKGMNSVTAGLQQMTQLVDNILDNARMSAGGLTLHQEEAQPEDLLAQVRRLFAIQAEVRFVKLDVEPSAGGGRPLLCDRKLLLRVLSNLVMNALKFTPRDGRVTLAALRREDAVEFRVSDTGCGIPKEQQGQMFRPFKQLAAGQAAGGYGLGLSVSKWFVELHGGRIWIESEEGKGTTFAFTIPARA